MSDEAVLVRAREIAAGLPETMGEMCERDQDVVMAEIQRLIESLGRPRRGSPAHRRIDRLCSIYRDMYDLAASLAEYPIRPATDLGRAVAAVLAEGSAAR